LSNKNKNVLEERKGEICQKQTVYDLTDKYCKVGIKDRHVDYDILLKWRLIAKFLVLTTIKSS
jgi:hypothetical protein